MAVITMKDVSYSYQEAEKCSLEHANLREEEGKVLVLCGQSGCGKTTILRLINGLIPFYYPGSLQGTVTVMGHPTTADTIYDLGAKLARFFKIQEVSSSVWTS